MNLTTAHGFRVGANRFVGTPSPDYGFAAADIGASVNFTAPSSVVGPDSLTYYCHGWSLKLGDSTLDSGNGSSTTITVTAENDNATFVWNYSTEPLVLHGVTIECSDGVSNPAAGFHEMTMDATETFYGPTEVVTNKAEGLIKSCTGWKIVRTDTSESTGSGTTASFTCNSANDGATFSWTYSSVPHVFTCDYTVVSAYGTSDPAAGAHTCNYGSTIDFRASAPVTNRPDHVRYVCTGWTLDVPGQASTGGSETEKSVTIDDSNDGLTLTWNYASEPLVYGVTVEGEYSTIEGGYGFKPAVYGATVNFEAPVAVTNRAERKAAECTGWRLRLRDGTVTEGTDKVKSITINDTTDGAKLTWVFKIVDVDLSAYTHYVVPAGTAGNVPTSPYRSWATAANTVEDALGACEADELVAVAPGVYSVNSRMTVSVPGVTIYAEAPDKSDPTGRVIFDAGYPARTTGIFNLAAANVKLRGLVLRGREVAATPTPADDPDTRPVPVVPTRDPKAARVMNGSWLALGDSITYFNDNLATGQAAIKNGHSLTKGYQTRVKETLTFTSYANWSINGGKVSGLLTKNYTSFDYVTIAIGVNDCGGKTAMGDFSDFTNATQRASANTFYGQYGRLIDKIRAANANVKIILCTPRHAYAYYSGGVYWLPPRSDVATNIGYSLEDYVKAVRKMAHYENLPICDFFAYCGDDATVGAESIDVALHPDDAGYARMTDELLKVFATLD